MLRINIPVAKFDLMLIGKNLLFSVILLDHMFRIFEDYCWTNQRNTLEQ